MIERKTEFFDENVSQSGVVVMRGLEQVLPIETFFTPSIKSKTHKAALKFYKFLKRVKYKSNIQFEIVPRDDTYIGFIILCHTLDSTSKGLFKTTIYHKDSLSLDYVEHILENESSFKAYIYERLKRVEIHELQEFFKFDDVCVFDAHKEER